MESIDLAPVVLCYRPGPGCFVLNFMVLGVAARHMATVPISSSLLIS